MTLLVGLDLGTSSVKAVAMRLDGIVVASSRVSYGHTDDGVRFEQDPEELWTGLLESMRSLGVTIDLREVSGIGVVAQTPSMVWVDGSGACLTPLMGWRDSRSASHVDRVSAMVSSAWQDDALGYRLPVSPGFLPTRLSWFAETHPEIVASARAVLTLKDFAVFRLTGETVTDAVNARGVAHGVTGVATAQFVRELGVDPALLPQARLPWEVAGQVRSTVARELGLRDGVSVAVGWGDLFSSMLSSGVLTTDRASFTITGTAEAAGVSLDHSLLVDGLVSMPVPGAATVTYGSTQAGGGSVAWLRNKIFSDVSEEWIAEQVGARCDSAPSLLFLPHLGGERAPLWDNIMRASFLGLDASHDRVDLTRAVLEGVAYSIRQILTRIDEVESVDTGSPVIVAGAASRNRAWNQIKADVLGRPIAISNLAEPSATGAAMLAATASGAVSTVAEAVLAMGAGSETVDPRPRFSVVYDELFAAYDESRTALAGLHARLAVARDLATPQ